MNVILAVIIYYLFLGFSGFQAELPKIGNYQFFGANQKEVDVIFIGAVTKNSPAEKAGLGPFDRVLTINDQPVTSVQFFTDEIGRNKGKEITMTWKNIRSGKLSEATMIPRVNPPENDGALGVGFDMQPTLLITYDSPVQRAFSGITHSTNLAMYNISAIGSLISESIEERSPEKVGGAVAGPVGIFKVVEIFLSFGDVKERILQLLNLAGMLSVSLAFFNILPIPALDGGRLFFILVEGITGKKVNQRFETLTHTIGMVVLLTLIALITFKDIVQFILPR